MLKLTLVEFFLRIIPEAFILICGIHIISRKSLDILKYIISSMLMAMLIFFVRWLPIYFGIHIIINIIITISIVVINGISLIKAIYSTLLMFLLLSLSEFFNILILTLLNIDTSGKNLSTFVKSLYGIPSLIFLLLFIIIMNYLLKMKEGIKNVSN